MAINGLIFSIDNNGISVQGKVFGSSTTELNPLLDNLPSDNRIIVLAKEVFKNNQINKTINPYINLPFTFGQDKVILSLKQDGSTEGGLTFTPGIDYVMENGKVRWKSDTAIEKTDELVAWGAINNYTAQAITFERINLLDSNVFNGGNEIKVFGDGTTDSTPYNASSIFLVVDKKTYAPDIDFFYSDGKIIWINTDKLLVPGVTDIFAYYFNKKSLQPYTPGELIVRLTLDATEDNQEQFDLSQSAKHDSIQGSQLFYEGNRYSYFNNYSIDYPFLNIKEDSNLLNNIEDIKKLDFSYLRDGNYVSNRIQYNYNLQAGTTTDISNTDLYLTQLPPNNQVTTSNKKTLVAFRGLIAVGDRFDNGDLSALAAGVKPMYLKNSQYIKWDYTARNPQLIPNSSDRIQVITWVDNFSQQHLNIEYFKRTSEDSFSLQKSIKQNKVIVFSRGEALFTQFGQFIYSGNTVFNLSNPLPTSGYDDIIIWYISDSSFANSILFDKIDVPSDIPANQEITLVNPILNIENVMIYINGLLIPRTSYLLGMTNNKLKINMLIPAGSRVMLIH